MKATKPGETARKPKADGKARTVKGEHECATYIVHAKVRHMIWLENKRPGMSNA